MSTKSKCKAALNIAGTHYGCDNKGAHDVHGNKKLHAIWADAKKGTKQDVTEEGLQAQVEALKTHVSAWSYSAREVMERITRAIGSSIGGFEFEHQRSYFGKPGRITLEGSTPDDGKEWYVELAITRIGEADPTDDWDDINGDLDDDEDDDDDDDEDDDDEESR